MFTIVCPSSVVKPVMKLPVIYVNVRITDGCRFEYGVLEISWDLFICLNTVRKYDGEKNKNKPQADGNSSNPSVRPRWAEKHLDTPKPWGEETSIDREDILFSIFILYCDDFDSRLAGMPIVL